MAPNTRSSRSGKKTKPFSEHSSNVPHKKGPTKKHISGSKVQSAPALNVKSVPEHGGRKNASKRKVREQLVVADDDVSMTSTESERAAPPDRAASPVPAAKRVRRCGARTRPNYMEIDVENSDDESSDFERDDHNQSPKKNSDEARTKKKSERRDMNTSAVEDDDVGSGEMAQPPRKTRKTTNSDQVDQRVSSEFTMWEEGGYDWRSNCVIDY